MGEDDDDEESCEPVMEAAPAATNREARLQELARVALLWACDVLRLVEPRPLIPEVTAFSETPRRCFVEMTRLYPPPLKRRSLIQINSARESATKGPPRATTWAPCSSASTSEPVPGSACRP